MSDEIGRIRRIVDKDGVYDIVLEFPKAWVTEVRPIDHRAAFSPTENVLVVSEWLTISLSEFIDARVR